GRLRELQETGDCPDRGSERTGAALEHVRGRVPAPEVARREVLDAEPRAFDELRDGSPQVATATESLPDRRETVLPPAYPRVRRLPVLHEEKAPRGLQHAPHFGERPLDVGDAAQGPRRDHAVDAPVVEGDRLGRSLEQPNGKVLARAG